MSDPDLPPDPPDAGELMVTELWMRCTPCRRAYSTALAYARRMRIRSDVPLCPHFRPRFAPGHGPGEQPPPPWDRRPPV